MIAESTKTLMIIAATMTLGCGGSDAPKIPLARVSIADTASAVEAAHAVISPSAKVSLDSGNTLFRKKAYAEALVQYRAASALAPQHAAPFFGIYMVARAINNSPMADSALAEIRRRNGPLVSAPHTLADSAVKRLHQNLRKGSS